MFFYFQPGTAADNLHPLHPNRNVPENDCGGSGRGEWGSGEGEDCGGIDLRILFYGLRTGPSIHPDFIGTLRDP